MGKYNIVKTVNSEKYELRLIQESANDYAIVIKSLIGAGYSSKHKEYNLVDNEGVILESRKIDLEISDFIINNIIEYWYRNSIFYFF